jgi:hypothetical protein
MFGAAFIFFRMFGAAMLSAMLAVIVFFLFAYAWVCKTVWFLTRDQAIGMNVLRHDILYNPMFWTLAVLTTGGSVFLYLRR